MIVERVDRRVLGALRFLSALDGMPVRGPLEVSAAPRRAGQTAPRQSAPLIRVKPGLSGCFVLHAAPGFGEYTDQFDPPPEPPDDVDPTIRLRVTDRSGHYFPREFEMALPRAIAATLVGGEPAEGSVFRPLDVTLFPASTAPVADSWAVLRIAVWQERAAPGNPPVLPRSPVPGALIRVLTAGAGGRLLARGFTEWRRSSDTPNTAPAEALVAVPGIPVTMWSDQPSGPVLTQNQSVSLQVRYDADFVPGAAATTAPPDLTRLEPAGGIFDSHVVAAGLTQTVPLQAGSRRGLELIFNPTHVLRLG